MIPNQITHTRGPFSVTIYPRGLGSNSNPEAHLIKSGVLCALRTQLTAPNALGALQLWANEYATGSEKETITALLRSALAGYGFAGMDAAGFLIPLAPRPKPWQYSPADLDTFPPAPEDTPHP